MNYLSLEVNIFKFAVFLYFVSAGLFILFAATHKNKVSTYARNFMVVAFITHTLAIITRTIGAGRLPLTNQYEFATCFAWGIALCFLIFEAKYKFRILGVAVAPVIFIIIGYALMLNKEVRELMPSLQSNWLSIHVTTAIISYGAFGVAFGVSLLYLVKEKMGDTPFTKEHFPSLKKIDLISYRAIALGFMFLTLVIVTGAIWAERSWGRYWAWDPKETWSLITWIIYSIYLHVRLTKNWKGHKTAIYAVVGFICVLITYIGVNIFIPSIHSYASVSQAFFL